MNGAAIIAEILKREGGEFLSRYHRNPLIEASAASDIRPILCRQERVGVGIADSYSRVNRGKRNGVFAAQAEPGIEKAFPGVAQAFSENVSLLVIAGGMPLERQFAPTFSAGDKMVSAGAFSAGIAEFDAARLSRHAQRQAWSRTHGSRRCVEQLAGRKTIWSASSSSGGTARST
jgi:thiamine pyrophosphate-dependent acetolactate synthase large subunit-like protein